MTDFDKFVVNTLLDWLVFY